ncbi:MAG: DNA polymerase, partial [Nitrosotalea sp.]
MSDETAAVRAYTFPEQEQTGVKRPDFVPKTLNFDRMLVFDTETTTDLYHNLKFGYFKVIYYGNLDHDGLFYDPIIVKGKEFDTLEQFCNKNKIKLYTIEQFRKIFLKEIFDLQSLCIGFNLPFDLTRIAIKSPNSRYKRKGGFSLQFLKNLDYPRLHVTHVTNTMSFIEFGSTKNKGNRFRGNFVDLRTLCNALTDKKYSLESACNAFKTEYKKQTGIKHGKITPQYIQYCINDVNATYSLYQKTKKEFDSYGLKIPVTKAYTPASIGKDFLKMIGVESFLNKNPKFPNEIIGYIMSSYFGGRVENKIRKTPTRVDVLDFLSMYPTVCTLQNLWKFVIADYIEYKEATREISDFIDKFTLADVQNPQNWARLQALVLIEPLDDVLPLRAKYGQKHVWNIGISHVASKTPLWYSLADVIASKSYTGRTPKILKAYKFVPVGIQKNLKTINIHGIEIDPYKDDLFKKLIEYRQTLKDAKDARQQIIKIITNAISYGIFVEINTLEESKKVPVDVYGLGHFVQ